MGDRGFTTQHVQGQITEYIVGTSKKEQRKDSDAKTSAPRSHLLKIAAAEHRQQQTSAGVSSLGTKGYLRDLLVVACRNDTPAPVRIVDFLTGGCSAILAREGAELGRGGGGRCDGSVIV